MLELYRRIRRRREELDMSQDELAQKLGYKSRSSIYKIEKGINDIPQSKIVAFAESLNTTPEYLMGWETEQAQRTVELTDNEIEHMKLYRMLNADNRRIIESTMRAFIGTQKSEMSEIIPNDAANTTVDGKIENPSG